METLTKLFEVEAARLIVIKLVVYQIDLEILLKVQQVRKVPEHSQ